MKFSKPGQGRGAPTKPPGHVLLRPAPPAHAGKKSAPTQPVAKVVAKPPAPSATAPPKAGKPSGSGAKPAAAAVAVEGKKEQDKKRKDGVTALHNAARWGKLNAVQSLLAKPDTKKEAKNAQGQTPLMVAAANGHTAVVGALLDAKAAPDNTDNGWLTALMLAAKAGHAAVVTALLAGGARPQCTNKYKQTALHLAALYGRADIVDALLTALTEHGKLELAGRAAEDGKTPRAYAEKRGHAAVLSVFDKHGVAAKPPAAAAPAVAKKAE